MYISEGWLHTFRRQMGDGIILAVLVCLSGSGGVDASAMLNGWSEHGPVAAPGAGKLET